MYRRKRKGRRRQNSLRTTRAPRSDWGGTVTAAPAGAVIICAASGYQRRRFESLYDFGDNCLRRLVDRNGQSIIRLFNIRELAGEDGFRCEVSVPGAQAASNKLIAALEINELNRSGAKVIAIAPFEGGASQDDVSLRFIPLFNRLV